MDKHIIWLGIRSYQDEQIAIYEACRNLNLSVVLIAPICPPYLKNKVIFYQADLNNNQSVLRLVESIRSELNCVLSLAWTDPPVELNALVSQLLGTPAPSPSSAIKARNKYEMIKAVWDKYPKYVPTFKLIDEHENFQNTEFPCIIKPISASGSKGIYYVQNTDEAGAALKQLVALGRHGAEASTYNRYGLSFLSEAYVSGQEFSVEGVVINNKCYIVGVTEKKVLEPWFTEYQHIFPANFTDSVLSEIHCATKCVIDAIGLNNAFFHLEAKWSADGFKLIEIAARIGGDLISTHLVSQSTRANWLSTVIQSLIDQTPPSLAIPTKYSAIKFQIASQTGTLRKYEFPELQSSLAHYHTTQVAMLNSSISLPPTDFSSYRLGYFVITADSRNQLEKTLDQISEQIQIKIE